jgi:hypothetical protein
MSYENNEFTSRPGAIPGRLFLCFIRKGVLVVHSCPVFLRFFGLIGAA